MQDVRLTVNFELKYCAIVLANRESWCIVIDEDVIRQEPQGKGVYRGQVPLPELRGHVRWAMTRPAKTAVDDVLLGTRLAVNDAGVLSGLRL